MTSNEQNQGLSLLGVEKPKPARSDTLNTFMKYNGLDNSHVLSEDEHTVAFHPGPKGDISHIFDYNKDNDTYDVTGESAKNFNDLRTKWYGTYGDWIKQSGKDDFESLRDMFINNQDEYTKGIHKRSGGKISPDKIDYILKRRFGTLKDIDNFLKRIYNK